MESDWLIFILTFLPLSPLDVMQVNRRVNSQHYFTGTEVIHPAVDSHLAGKNTSEAVVMLWKH